MEQKVVIRYLSGTKGSAVEEFPTKGRKELIAGRAPQCDIRYDLNGDELVSRRHMRIEIPGSGEPEFTAVDLGSRNGTFINRQRIAMAGKLRPGDVVQLGAGGPEFVFDIEPRDEQAVGSAGKTTSYDVLEKLRAEPESLSGRDVPEPLPLMKSKRKRGAAVLVVVLVMLLSAGLVFQLRSRRWPTGKLSFSLTSFSLTPASITGFVKHAALQVVSAFKRPPIAGSNDSTSASPSQIRIAAVDAIGKVEAGWMLLDDRSRRQLRQVYIENAAAGDGAAPLLPDAGQRLPLFVLLSDHQLQPVLTMSDDARYRPIAGTYRSAGFIADASGLMLTSRRVAEPWTVPYEWPADATAGVVATFDKRLKLMNTAVIARRQFPLWLPLDSQFVLADSLDSPAVRLTTKDVHATIRMDYLTVDLGQRSRRLSAQVVRTSGRLDLAVIRTDPGAISGPPLRKGLECKVGDEAITVDLNSEWRGKVAGLRSSGSVLQYEIVGQGASHAAAGEPIFDAEGEVFAIQATSDPLRPAGSLATPIRYGVELLSAQKR